MSKNFLKYIYHTLPIPKEKDRPKGLFDSIERFLKVFYLSLTYHYSEQRSTLLSLLVSIGLISSLSRYELFNLTKPPDFIYSMHYILWVAIFVSTIICIWLYLIMLFRIFIIFDKYRESWKQTWKKFGLLGPLTASLFCVIVSLYQVHYVYTDMGRWQRSLSEHRLPSYWFYKMLMYSRIIQIILSCSFISISAPVTHYWLGLTSQEIREDLLYILPWHLLNKLLITLATIQSILIQSPTFESFAIFVVFQVFLLYIPAFSLTTANTYVFPILYNPKGDQKVIKGKLYQGNTENEPLRAMVTGVTTPVVEYPNRTELVRGGTLERFRSFLQPAHSSTRVDNSQDTRRAGEGRQQLTAVTNVEYSFSGDTGDDITGGEVEDVKVEEKNVQKTVNIKEEKIIEETEEELKELEKEAKSEDTEKCDDVLQQSGTVEIYSTDAVASIVESKESLLVIPDEESSLHPSPIDQGEQLS